MAMEIVQMVNGAHEDSLSAIAYNRVKREVYTAAEGDKAIKVWDLKTGQLLRTQTAHKGMVTCLAYASSAKLLFSGSMDSSIGVWTEKGSLLQVVPTGWPVFSMAWGSKQKILVAGGNSVLHLYKVDISDVLRLKHAHHTARPTARQQQQQQQDGAGFGAAGSPGLALVGPNGSQDAPQEGGTRPSQELDDLPEPPTSQRVSDTDASLWAPGGAEPTSYSWGDAESDAAASTAASGSRPKAAAAGSKAAGQAIRQREEEYHGVCHTDVVKCIVITESGKIFTAGFDRCICCYDCEKLDKPREAFKRIKDCGRAGLTSLAFDPHCNVLLAGSLDGTLRVWSVEGRCLDKFEGLSSKPVSVAYLPQVNQWWATGRFSKVAAIDPRAPAIITEYVAQPNQLLDHAVELLYAPPGSDLVMAGTAKHQLVVWQYNPTAAHRVFCGHQDWVEGVLVPQASEDLMDQGLFSFSADGHVCSWELDAEQNCDVYRLVEDAYIAECNVLCLVHIPDKQCVVSGCDDGIIRLHYLEGSANAPSILSASGEVGPSGAATPLLLTGHEDKVTGLAALPGQLLLSSSADRSLRVWDLKTMKLLHAELDAHDTSIQCLEHCQARKEVATCGMGSKVKVWSVRQPAQIRLALVLDHTDPEKRAAQQAAAKAKVPRDVNAEGKTDMQWLTCSDIDGLGVGQKVPAASALPSIVAEAIANAAEDVPAITQVRWLGYKQCWVTAADDEIMRLWSTSGERLESIPYKGGSCRYLYVDEVNQLLLAATADKCAYLFSLAAAAAPLARFQGHGDIISCIGYIPALDCYVTSSWDSAIRVWKRPQQQQQRQQQQTTGSTGPTGPQMSAGGEPVYILPEDSENPGNDMSEYEKVHPLVVPKALSQDSTMALLKAIAATDAPAGSSKAAAAGRRPGRVGVRGVRESALSDEGSQGGNVDAPGSLGAKLQELGKRLLQEINDTASKVVTEKGPAWKGPALQQATALQHSDSARSTGTVLPASHKGHGEATTQRWGSSSGSRKEC